MNLRDLKYLLALVEHRHFGKAADACFVSQPALSMQFKKLEESLGVQLLERTNKSVLLTPVGKAIVDRAKIILLQVDEMQSLAKLAKDPYSGECHLGIFPTLAPYLLPHIMPGLSKQFSKISYYLVEAQTMRILEMLKEGLCDVALLALPVVDPELISIPLFAEEFVLAVPKTHELAKRKSVNQSDLKNRILLLLEDGHCMREQALEVCHRAKAAEEKTFQATSLETLRHMVTANVGITLMPKLACKSNDDISYLPFAVPKPTRTIGLVYRATSAKKIMLEEMGSKLKQLIAKQKIVKTI